MTHINNIDWTSDKLVVDEEYMSYNGDRNFHAEIENMNIRVQTSSNHCASKIAVFYASMTFNNNDKSSLDSCPMVNVHKKMEKYVNKETDHNTNWCFMFIFIDNIKIYINNNLVVLTDSKNLISLMNNKLHNKKIQIKFNITNKHKNVCLNDKYIIEIFEIRYDDNDHKSCDYNINIKNNEYTLINGKHKILIDANKCRDILNEPDIIIV